MAKGVAIGRLAIVLAICVVVSFALNFVMFLDEGKDDFWALLRSKSIPISEFVLVATTKDHGNSNDAGKHNDSVLSTRTDLQDRTININNNLLAGLSCLQHGGPSDEAAAEMVYWRDIPDDAEYTSPFYEEGKEKFLLWDMDAAGFNNKRISFENFLLLAHSMGRTLVMPPKGLWKLFDKDKDGHKLEKGGGVNRWGMEDFFDIDAIGSRQRGLKIIGMEEFLLQHAMTGKLKNKRGKPSFPPKNQTDWNDTFLRDLKKWLKTVTAQITWRPEDCLGAFPAQNDPHNFDTLQEVQKHIFKQRRRLTPSRWINRPTPVDASIRDRMSEIMTRYRTKLCFYDQRLQEETYLYYKILYDPRNYTLSRVVNIRLLIYFYCFFFFEDWKQDLWAKRFIRDNVRYRDDVQCAAARIVESLRDRVRERTHTDGDGDFHTMHIRRDPEFEEQYGDLPSAEAIYDVCKADIPDGSTVYIASDEANKTFFQPLARKFDILFLNNFTHLVQGIDPNYYALVDQLVASRGKKFFGAFCSTFTGFINRMRGYHSTKDKLPGHESGAIESYFYNFQREGKRNKMRVYHPPVSQWFNREYPIAWRDIDHDVTYFAD